MNSQDARVAWYGIESDLALVFDCNINLLLESIDYSLMKYALDASTMFSLEPISNFKKLQLHCVASPSLTCTWLL